MAWVGLGLCKCTLGCLHNHEIALMMLLRMYPRCEVTHDCIIVVYSLLLLNTTSDGVVIFAADIKYGFENSGGKG